MKKFIVALLAVVMIFSAFAGCAKETPEVVTPTTSATDAPETPPVEATQEIRVGTSNIYVTIPASYTKGAMSVSDTDEGQVAYYKSADSKMDFDLYHWAKAVGETLDSVAAEETKSEVAAVSYGDIAFVAYNDVEEFDGEKFPTKTYIAEDGDYFVEFVFWADGEAAEKQIEDILNTVTRKQDEGKTGEGIIRIGTSDLYITSDKGYEKGEMSREDTDLCQVGYFKSANSLVDFDVYFWAKGDGETIESTAALEGEEFKAEIIDREINGIKVKHYDAAAEASEDGSFPTRTFIIDDGDYIAEIVFWLDGETADADVEAIISTLSR